ncbi:MAG: hypothetical protein AAB134_07745, partial [Pseudomonadota bacterium]
MLNDEVATRTRIVNEALNSLRVVAVINQRLLRIETDVLSGAARITKEETAARRLLACKLSLASRRMNRRKTQRAEYRPTHIATD